MSFPGAGDLIEGRVAVMYNIPDIVSGLRGRSPMPGTSITKLVVVT